MCVEEIVSGVSKGGRVRVCGGDCEWGACGGDCEWGE